jgi:hypothetical protein
MLPKEKGPVAIFAEARDRFVVVVGDPASGFELFGPFEDYEAAEHWADGRPDTWTIHLLPPEKPPEKDEAADR